MAIEAGADRIGFVFFPKSPRHLTLERARMLAREAAGRAEIVVLTVDADDAAIEAIIAAVAPAWLQLHGNETPERAAAVRQRFGIPVMKAMGVSGADDIPRALPYAGVADAILFDAKPPRGATLPGGNGVAFDWTLLRGAPAGYMLSGGLSPENVADAVRVTGATAVDVSSGVESAPGVKDADKIRAFVKAAKTAPLA